MPDGESRTAAQQLRAIDDGIARRVETLRAATDYDPGRIALEEFGLACDYWRRSQLAPDDRRSPAAAVRLAVMAIPHLHGHPWPTTELVITAARRFTEMLLRRDGDPGALPQLIKACRDAVDRLATGTPEHTQCARPYAEFLFVCTEYAGLDLLDEPVAAWAWCVRVTAPGDPFLRTAHFTLARYAFRRFQRHGGVDHLDRAIEAARMSRRLGAAHRDDVANGIGDLFLLGRALRLRFDAEQNRDSRRRDEDLDEAIDAFRVVVAGALEDEDREAATIDLCELLLRRFDQSGNSADIDEVIEQYERSRSGRPMLHRSVPDAVMRAMRLKSKHSGDAVDSSLAALASFLRSGGTMNPIQTLRRFGEPYSVVAAERRAHTHPDHELAAEVEAEIARLRAEPGLSERIDLLDDLADALQARMIAVPSDDASDELVAGLEQLVWAIPAADVIHRATHACSLGLALHQRGLRTGSADDQRSALPHLVYGATVAGLETQLRIQAAELAGDATARLEDWVTAAEHFRYAVGLLPRLVPRQLPTPDYFQRLIPMLGLVSKAAAATVRAGDPAAALVLLEQGRGILIGRVVDARDGLTDELRRIAGELAHTPDPHRPGGPSAVDRRRALERAWDEEVARIRAMDGFGDYLMAPSIDDLRPAAAAGPIISIVVSGLGSTALILRASGPVESVPLLRLTPESLQEQVETFFGVLPFAELSAHDIALSAAAQEPLSDVLAWLWDVVASPVLDRVGPVERVWWIATGQLAMLPLHAAARDAHSVLDRVVSSYAPTIKLLAAGRRPAPREPGPSVLVAVPDAPDRPPLPGTVSEATEVMRRFPGTRTLGPASRPQDLLAVIGECGWLHVACHATTRAEYPAASALHVHGGSITASEVMAVGARAGRLAYLSACETALSEGYFADEVIHLGSAFQVAGFRHVIGTLWRVTDGTAAETTRLFYGMVGTDEDRAPFALHHAAQQLRQRYPQLPARWAPYVHVGG
ncbi:CHAT domain-containing protein [Nocardia sp. NPDC049526]|uniref:CHAT domain-containing protein n=1 Tax=Nocardia sp. NPDC049526 TaxID=3364316 RepID=UPI0037B7B273